MKKLPDVIHIQVKTKSIVKAGLVAGFLFVAIACTSGFAGPSQPEATATLPLPIQTKDPKVARYQVVDQRQQDCLARNIYFEARNQSDLGQLAVGLTTVIRARDSGKPNNICAVVNKKAQFSWVNAKKKQKGPATPNEIEYLKAQNMASKLLHGDYDNLIPIFAPTHYHTASVNPKWNQKMVRLAEIGDHIFYQ